MNHSELQGTKVIVRWQTKNAESIRLIRKRFDIPQYTTINGHSPAIIKPADKEVFLETVRRGFISYLPVDWSFNGFSYSW